MTVRFFPKITLPTRFTEQFSTLIDNVFSNNIEDRATSGILLNQISDQQFRFGIGRFITNQQNIYRITPVHFLQKAEKKT